MLNGKETKNGSDYRKSLLLVRNWLLETAPVHFVTKIILTMCKIQEISYLPESKRNLKKILRLGNIKFFHSMFLVINLKNNSKSLINQLCKGNYLVLTSILFIDMQLTNTDYFLEKVQTLKKGKLFSLALKQILN